MQIPNIGFNHKKSDSAEFEIIEIQYLQNRTVTDSDPRKPHRISFFNLIYIEEGEGVHMVDFKEYPFSAGSIILVQREQVHSFDFSSKLKGKLFLFTQEFLDQVHANMRLPSYTPTHLNTDHSPLVKLNKNDQKSFQVLIDEIIKENMHPKIDPLIIMYLFSTLSLILHRLRTDLFDDELTQGQRSKLARFFELLFVNFKKVRDANWYAMQVNTTYKTLNQVCKLATGLTLKQLIDSYIVLEMKRTLVVNHTNCVQVGYDFGFEDPSNFVKYFKKHTSMTPSQFQKKYLHSLL